MWTTSAFVLTLCAAAVSADIEKTRIFNQTLDHFNSENKGGKWQQR